jgi:hypothetical protein
MLESDGRVHGLYIKDRDKLMDVEICPKCNVFARKKGDKHMTDWKLKLQTIHVKQCDGKLKQQVPLPSISLPYLPHIFSNKEHTEAVPKGIADAPLRTYITYDFETAIDPVSKDFGEGSVLVSTLHPITVAWTVETPEGTRTYSIYRKDMTVDDSDQYWLNTMLETGPELEQINVIGCNSARFDIHLFMKHILPKDSPAERQTEQSPQGRNEQNGSDISSFGGAKSTPAGGSGDFSIRVILGNVKMSILEHTESKRQFRFIDAMGFLSGETLGQNAQAPNPGAGREKRYFPYEFLTVENYQEEWHKSERFTHESFYSSLKQSNITELEYQIYLHETEGMNGLSYLLHYNERDTQIILPILVGLTDLFWDNKIDMLRNVSLSSCSSQAKYTLAYKDFDIDGDSNVPCWSMLYNLTMPKWPSKVDNYKKQDLKAGRDISNHVSKKNFAWASVQFSKGCRLCHCQFDIDNNIPTLDRINNEIGRSKDNLLACCQRCNRYKSDKDGDIAKLKNQLHKYAQLKNLPITLCRENESVRWAYSSPQNRKHNQSCHRRRFQQSLSNRFFIS